MEMCNFCASFFSYSLHTVTTVNEVIYTQFPPHLAFTNILPTFPPPKIKPV